MTYNRTQFCRDIQAAALARLDPADVADAELARRVNGYEVQCIAKMFDSRESSGMTDIRKQAIYINPSVFEGYGAFAAAAVTIHELAHAGIHGTLAEAKARHRALTRIRKRYERFCDGHTPQWAILAYRLGCPGIGDTLDMFEQPYRCALADDICAEVAKIAERLSDLAPDGFYTPEGTVPEQEEYE